MLTANAHLHKRNKDFYWRAYRAIRIGWGKFAKRHSDVSNHINNWLGHRKAKLHFVTTNAKTKISSLLEHCHLNNKYFVSIGLPYFIRDELLTIGNRVGVMGWSNSKWKHGTLDTNNAVFFCSLIKPDYSHMLGPLDDKRRSKFSILKDYKQRKTTKQTILIPEQCRPEGYTHNDKYNWIEWLHDKLNQIDGYNQASDSPKQVEISLHPNRKTWAQPQLEIPKQYKYFTKIIQPLADDEVEDKLKDVGLIVTMSSRFGVTSLLYGVPVVIDDLNSPIYHASVNFRQALYGKQPHPSMIDAVLNNLAYSHWTYEEMIDGTFCTFLYEQLIPEYDRQIASSSLHKRSN